MGIRCKPVNNTQNFCIRSWPSWGKTRFSLLVIIGCCCLWLLAIIMPDLAWAQGSSGSSDDEDSGVGNGPPVTRSIRSNRNKSAQRDAQSSGPSAKGASADLPVKVVIGKPTDLVLTALGKTYRVKACTTGIEDEYLVVADDEDWPKIAQGFGKTLVWNERRGRLTVIDEGKSLTLALGQEVLPREVGERKLDVVSQRIKRETYFPISCLEDFLGVRVTVTRDGKTGWIDPLINVVRLEGDGRKPNLVINSSAPISFKTFGLSNPERYVVDFSGGVLNTASLRINHPEIGDIRLGQFTLGPAVSRVVIPVTSGLKIKAPTQKVGTKFVFALELPEQPKVTTKQQKLLSYSVTPTATGSKVEMQFSGPVQYEWNRFVPPDNRFFLDLSPVVLVGKKNEHSVNTRNVKSVRVSQFQTKPVPTTRVVIDLRNAVTTKVTPGSKPNSLLLEVAEEPFEASMSILRGYGSTSSGSMVSGGSGAAGFICIDPGHGGGDSGAVHSAGIAVEKDVTLDICLRLAKLLRARGWRVVLTRESDRDVSYAGSSNSEELWARVKVGNDAGTDLFVSVHCNASQSTSAVGTSLHVYKKSDRVLAEEMYDSVLAATGRASRGIQQDRFFVLAHSIMPAVLIETAFISNSEGARLLATPSYRQRVAEGIADGLDQYARKYIKTGTHK